MPRPYHRLPVFGLLDIDYYLERYEDVAKLGVNPIHHYLNYGINELRRPNRFLDVASASTRLNLSPRDIVCNPAHTEQAAVSSTFDSNYYREAYKEELIDYKYSALAHYFHIGRWKGYKTTSSGIYLEEDLANRIISEPTEINTVNALTAEDRKLLIVVPVYKGVKLTKRCLKSVSSSRLPRRSRVVVINDNSPEVEMRESLIDACSQYGFEYMENAKNLGFVMTINLASSLRKDKEDMMILNSDTEVPPLFAQRMQGCLYHQKFKIGTVTPLSNNATIFTIPYISEGMPLLANIEASSLDYAASQASKILRSQPTEVPTGVGFAMLINSELLDETGTEIFDYNAFGAGYGEEVDFCCKIKQAGWINVACPNVAVYHSGGESFGSQKTARIAQASQIIRSRYPSYHTNVSDWCKKDPLSLNRIVALATLSRLKNIKCSLIIQHDFGGGTQRYIDERVDKDPYTLFASLLFTGQNCGRMKLQAPGFIFHLDFPSSIDIYEFSIRLLNPSTIEVHSLIGAEIGRLYKAIRLSEAELIVYIHDYSYICPKNYMINLNDTFCNAPIDLEDCAHCLDKAGINKNIDAYRKSHELLLRTASQVICPSESTKEMMRRYIPIESYVVIPHEDASTLKETRQKSRERLNSIKNSNGFNIVVIGYLTKHKGLMHLEKLIKYWKSHKKDQANNVKWSLIGKIVVEREKPPLVSQFVTEYGEYAFGEAVDILQRLSASVIFFPGLIPETYSYTLSEAIASGFPILAPDIGSFPERLSGTSDTFIYPITSSPKFIYAKIEEIFMLNY